MDDDSLEKWKVELEGYKCDLEKWKTDTQCSMIRYQQINMQGQGALKAALLVNGGAVVALLAFIGSTVGKDVERSLLLALCFSMLLFLLATLSATVASGVTYLAGLVGASSDEDRKVSKWKLWRHWFFYNAVAITLVVVSYVLFLVGSLNAYCAFVGSV